MPNITVVREKLMQALGEQYTDSQFEDLCFEFGIELDNVTTEKAMVAKEKGDKAAAGLSEEILYVIEIPANRYDLLCLEGLVQSLRVFLKKDSPPNFRRIVPESPEKIIINPDVLPYRRFVVGAILRNITFNEQIYNSFIELQTKLHSNICRQRTLASIGTHDYDTLQGPFNYTAVPPAELKFKALNQQEEYNAVQLFDIYRNVSHLKKFLPIIEDFPLYPVIYDSNGVVASLPPIINGDHSKVTLQTKNVFIEVTATDLTKAKIVLDTVVAAFSQYCTDRFSVEVVEVVNPDGTTLVTPEFESREFQVSTEYVRKLIGVNIPDDHMADLLQRMCLETQLTGPGTLNVKIPITRSDVLHPCDIAEDVAIAYGYNNITMKVAEVATVSRMQPLNHLTDLLRVECAVAGFTEIVTMVLLSQADNYEKMQIAPDNKGVIIANPSSTECQMPRTSLLPGLLKTLSCNKAHSLPMQIFEISDVVEKTHENDTGAQNRRKLAALYNDTSAGLSIVHGMLDIVMSKLGFEFQRDYSLELVDHPSFLRNWGTRVLFRGQEIGVMGVINPKVLEAFEISSPVSAVEIDIQALRNFS